MRPSRCTSADEIGTLAVGFNRMAERIRELRQSDYQNVSRLKSEFIASASRELREPLSSVRRQSTPCSKSPPIRSRRRSAK